MKLENGIKLLKLECNTDETTTLLEIEKQSKPTMNVSKTQKDVKNLFMKTDDLLHKGIAKFFFGEEIQT